MPPAERRSPASPQSTINSLRWSVGIFLGLVGAMMLVTPHQFSRPVYVALQPFLQGIGGAFVLTGVGLFTLSSFTVPGLLAVAIHVAASLELLLLASSYIPVGGWTGALSFLALGFGTALAPLFARIGAREARADALALPIAVGCIITGITLLAVPEMYGSPIYDVIRGYLFWFGAAFFLSGLLLATVQLVPAPTAFYRLAHLFAGGTLLAFFAASAVPLRASAGMAYYGGFGAVIVAKPWLESRLVFNPRSLQARIALALATAVSLPMILVATMTNDVIEDNLLATAAQLRGGRDATFGILLICTPMAILSGVIVAGWVAGPLRKLTVAVERLAAGDPSAPIETSRVPEVAALTSAFTEMRAQLQERTAEREDACKCIQAQNEQLQVQSEEIKSQREELQFRNEELQALNAAILRKEQEHQAIFSSMADPLIVYDKDSVIVEANPAAIKVYGFNPVGANRPQLARRLRIRHPDGRFVAAEEAPSSRALQGEIVLNEPFKFLNMAGEEIAMLISSAPLTRDGKAEGAVTVWHDVTEKEKAEEELARSNHSVVEILESITDGFFALDRDWRFTYINKRAAANVGFAPEQLIRHELWEKFAGILGTEHETYYRKAMEERTAQQFEMAGVLTDQWYEIRVYPSAEGISVYWQDITERKRADAERERLIAYIQRHASELDAIITSIGDGLAVYDMEGRITLMNGVAQEILGFSEQERSLPLEQRRALLRTEDPEGKRLTTKQGPAVRALRGETVSPQVIAYNRSGRRRRWASVSAGPLLDVTGQQFGAVLSMTDVTELHELQERLQDVLRAVSHDLRTPLTVIQGNAQLLEQLLEKSAPDAIEREVASGITAGAIRMNTMIQDLVDSARQESGQLHLNLRLVDLTSFIPTVVSRLTGMADVERVSVDLAENLPLVSADPDRLERVVINLLINALKYSSAPHPVIINADKTENAIVVSVADRGIGISADDLEHIFDRYYRPRRARKGEGLGLGLYIGRTLVEAHGGRIWAASKEGKGSTFHFSLPLP